MALKAVYDKQEEIPEAFVELYAERGGKFELAGIEGIKTQADVDRIDGALKKERDEHKKTKAALGAWGDLKHDEVRTQLDSIDELRAKAEAAGDPAKTQQIVEAQIKARMLPVERDMAKLREGSEALLKENQTLKAERDQRTIHDEVRGARIKSKALDIAEDDILLNADRMFEIVEDSDGKRRVVTRDGVGVTPGISAEIWLSEMQAKRPYWWPASEGGGARGAGGNGAGGGANPWKRDSWSLTEQAKYTKQHGTDRAAAMAKAAGSKLGALTPPPPAK